MFFGAEGAEKIFFGPLSPRYNGTFFQPEGGGLLQDSGQRKGFDCRVSDRRPTYASLIEPSSCRYALEGQDHCYLHHSTEVAF